jgi:hypothetical protein
VVPKRDIQIYLGKLPPRPIIEELVDSFFLKMLIGITSFWRGFILIAYFHDGHLLKEWRL